MTREDFNAQVNEAIKGRLDPDYVSVKLSAAEFSAFGEEVTFALPGSEPLTGLSTPLAKQIADRMVQSAPEALRTTPRDFNAARERGREMVRAGELTESARKAREKIFGMGTINDHHNNTSDAVAKRLGL